MRELGSAGHRRHVLELKMINVAYEKLYGHDLAEGIENECSGDYKDCLLACIWPERFIAEQVAPASFSLSFPRLSLSLSLSLTSYSLSFPRLSLSLSSVSHLLRSHSSCSHTHIYIILAGASRDRGVRNG